MTSDLESLKESGGTYVAPKPFTPPELKKEMYQVPAAPPPLPPMPPRIPSAKFGEPQRTELPRIEELKAYGAPPIIEEESKKGGIKKILVWSSSALVIAGFGFLGYFYIFPFLFGGPASAPKTVTEQPPVTEIPIATIPEGTPEPIEESLPITEPVPQPTPTLKPHQTFLKTSDSISPASLANVDLNSLTAALRQEALKSLPSGSLTEVTLSDADGQIPASMTLSLLLPELTPGIVASNFDEDFTTALYYDANGIWPAYILRLRLGTNQSEVQAVISSLESSPNLVNLFLTSPGTPAAGFKEGQANGATTRYLTYPKKGAGLNFAWSGDKLIISTSYNGLKKILSSLVQ
ncbi:MAG: hypothetical protein HZB99_04420 [Candidatus Harrisonbacteria bacterium]|nr:hypothetical protein [Candidatus Harrisonbacteria bacterium]